MARRYSHYLHQKKKLLIRRLILGSALFVALYFLIPLLFINTIRIETDAMSPTIQSGDNLIVLPALAYRWPPILSPPRGAIVLARPQSFGDPPPISALYRLLPSKERRARQYDTRIVRRVVGLPGERIREHHGNLLIQSPDDRYFKREQTISPYRADPAALLHSPPYEHQLGNRQYFLAGDNRVAAIDSRHWGAVDRTALKAFVIWRYWPLSRFGPVR